ncbi:MFS transporter [Pseudarthrobacter sp. J64]|uniref:MFS transporter n=1 Tax=Pseudarthrobacter sp. J64 TaxID=3116485 RepID=UPI002E80791A|nr:MFS transporter [Pseudarthrobacter sp. J64]MEE2569020.1 MFS transporter [Pseudarthrobacter sp. J64]
MTSFPTTALDLQRVQRRTVLVLSSAQLLSGIGNGATLSVGSLLAVQLSGSDAWAGSVTTIMTLGTAVAAMPLAGLAGRRGRRVGLMTGLLAGLAGALLVVASTVAASFFLLLAGSALLGIATAANLQARFAAVDLAEPEQRGRSLAIVVWAVTAGAVAGPNLIKPGAVLGEALGLPAISGPFLFSVAGLFLAAVLIAVGLRPDPLLYAAERRRVDLAAAGAPPAVLKRQSLRHGLRAVRDSPKAMMALAAIVTAHACMAAVMSMTPLHLQILGEQGTSGGGHDHSMGTDAFALIGFTISLHIAGMYALSPLMGWLTDRVGRTATIMMGHGLIFAATACAGFGAGTPALVTVGLVLLGLGWSAATIAGSTLLAESVQEGDRVLVQGVSDTLMSAAGAVGAGSAGLVLSWIGYQGLNMVALGAAGMVLALVLAMAIRERQAAPVSFSG